MFNGGPTSGLVEETTWESWGDGGARGAGFGFTSDDAVAGSDREPAPVVAFDFGERRRPGLPLGRLVVPRPGRELRSVRRHRRLRGRRRGAVISA